MGTPNARALPGRFSAPSYLYISPNVLLARPMRRRAARIPPPVPPLGPSHTRVTRDQIPLRIPNFHVPGGYGGIGTRRIHVPAMSR